MTKINLSEIAEQQRSSPKGKFGRSAKNISIALGREVDSTDRLKQHPFDIALVRVEPGKSLCPYHSHSAEWELYVVVSGVGLIRDRDGTTKVVAGDAFVFKPEEAHQLTNGGTEDFVYYVIADNAVGDTCHYPDSGKWAVYGEGEYPIVRGEKAGYFDGEE